MISILCLNPAIDTSIRVATLAGRDCLAQSVEYSLGGKAINAARWLGANGVSHRVFVFGNQVERAVPDLDRVVFFESGNLIRQNFTLFDDAGLVAHVRTPISTSLEKLKPAVCRFLDVAAESEFAVLAGSVPSLTDDPQLDELCQLLSTSRAPWILDTTSFSFNQLRNLDLHTIKVNGSEFRDLAKIAGSTDIATTTLQETAKQLGSRVIVTQGPGDVLAVDAGGVCLRFPIPDKYRLSGQSVVGSGDSFLAGYLFGMDMEKEFSYSVRLGVAFGISAQDVEGQYVALSKGKIAAVMNDIGPLGN